MAPPTPNQRTIFVDLGGVALDNHAARARDFVAVWRSMAEHSTLPPPFLERIHAVEDEALGRAIWGRTPAKAAERIVKHLFTPEEIRTSHVLAHTDGLMQHDYKQQRKGKSASGDILDEEPPFPGIRDALESLKAAGYRLLAISRKDETDLSRALDHHGLSGCFDGIVSTHHEEKNPHILNEAMKLRGLKREDVLLIGDTEQDMLVCEQMGIRRLMARWGQIEKLDHPATKADSMEGLPELVSAEFERALPAAKKNTHRVTGL